MANIKVDPEALQTAARNFQQHHQDLGDLIDRVSGVVTSLEPAWSSGASVSFQDFMQGWHKTIGELHGHLQAVHQNVNVGGQGYQDTDDRIRKGFQI